MGLALITLPKETMFVPTCLLSLGSVIRTVRLVVERLCLDFVYVVWLEAVRTIRNIGILGVLSGELFLFCFEKVAVPMTVEGVRLGRTACS